MTGFIEATLATAPTVQRVFAMAAPSQGGAGSAWVVLLPYAAIGAIFYFIILRPMKGRQKKVAEFRDALKVGDKVITTSGIYGSITKMNDRSVQLQVADMVRIEVSRAAVGGYQGQDPVVQDSGSM
jgi:preprotein translocase subunit YajC